MARLIYSMITSLDGYVADAAGDFDWGEPDMEAHTFMNERQRQIGTHLYGRRMYDVLRAWDDPQWLTGQPAHLRDFAVTWQAAEKIVYSTTLPEVSGTNTRLERTFEPDTVRQLKASSDRDLVVAGPGLASHALRAGLVDELQLYVAAVVIGGGLPALPGGHRSDLRLLEEQQVGNGMVFLRYDCRPVPA